MMRCDCGNTVKSAGYVAVDPPVVRPADYVPVLGEDYDIGCNPFTYECRLLCLHCRRDVINPNKRDDNKQ